MGIFGDLIDKILPSDSDEDEEFENEDLEDDESEEEETEEEKEEYTPKSTKSAFDSEYNNKKVVSFDVKKNSGSGSIGVKFVSPRKLRDAGEAANLLKEGKIVIVCFGDNIESREAARILDFLRGVVYILKASIRSIEGNSYIMIPNGVPADGVDLNLGDTGHVELFEGSDY